VVGRGLTRWLSGHYHQVSARGTAAVMLLGAMFGGAALFGVAWYAGPVGTLHHFAHLDLVWGAAAAGAVVLSHLGYAFGYREIVRADDGPQMAFRRAALAVTAGFGLLTPRSGFTFDRSVWAAAGLSETEARKRVTRLAMLEYLALVPASYAAVIALLVMHHYAREYVLISWAIGVPSGSLMFALVVIRRRHGGLTARVAKPLRQIVDGFLDVVRNIPTGAGALAVLGMVIYWAADITALGCCLELVHGARLPVAALIVGYSTGYALTRRSTPMAGLGVTELLLPLALYWMHSPLAVAVVAVVFYRAFNLWLPALSAVPALHGLRIQIERPRDNGRGGRISIAA
jgi:ABC-type amino acid transport system permease subunit